MRTKRRISALLVCAVMIMSMAIMPVMAEETNNITVTFTVSKYGELLEEATLVPVELCGKEEYTLDDVFKEAHSLYYDGDDGYASEGVAVKNFWGDESDFFGYQVNGGTANVEGLNFVVDDGDYIDAVIYKNEWPDTEIYTSFNTYTAEATEGENLELTLTQLELDENWQKVFSPCEGAKVLADGVEYTTDENGRVQLSFEKAGTYVVTAEKSKLIGDEEVPAITAPVCRINVDEPDCIAIMHNIANKYSDAAIVTDSNMIWLVADMAVYNSLYPEKEMTLSDEIKQACIDKIIADSVDSSSSGVLAKSIIALRSMGYDARQVYGADLRKTDLVAKLTQLVDERNDGVTNMYTLPYVMIALWQKEDYATVEQMNFLIDAAIANKTAWQYNEWGTDAATAMLLALAPYYDVEEVRTTVDETISIIEMAQDEAGAIGNAASTGLAMAALSAFDIDVEEIVNNDKSLIDGLMNYATDSLDGFEPMSNSFSTEQGFRGLLAWQLMRNNNGIMYDFSSYPADAAHATWAPQGCPVVFDVEPENAQVTISNIDMVGKNKYDLAEGTYSYTVSASGYRSRTGVLTITSDDVANHTLKNINVALQIRYSGGGGTTYVPEKDDEDRNEKEEIKEEIKEEQPKFEVEFDETTFTDVKKDDWYYEAVKYVYENNIMQGTDEGFEPQSKMTRAMLVTVLYRLEEAETTDKQTEFTDVGENDWYADAVAWAADAGIATGVSDGVFAPDENVTREQMAVIIYRYAQHKGYDVKTQTELTKYSDSNDISSWAIDALSWANGTELINGTSVVTVSPKDTATRAQVATILMRFCGSYSK